MRVPAVGAHNDLHSDQGARKDEHPGRSRDPIIKVHDIAWLEFEKPDLTRAETFSRAFGFSTALHTIDDLFLRGTDAGSTCVLIRRGPRSRFVGTAYTAAEQSDVLGLAEATGTKIRAMPESLGGVAVDLVRYEYRNKLVEGLAKLHQAGSALAATPPALQVSGGGA